MSKDTVLRQAVRGALALGAAGSMAGAGVALAQTAAPPSGTANGTKLSKIIVTGSHIPQTAIASPQPVISINRQQIDQTGFTSVGELLTHLSQAAPSINLQTTNNVGASAGAVYLNLHNLGSARLLVLVNGQRVAPSINGSVDFSVFPLSVVDHIQILLDGASPVYGTGAIAGVVNIITTKNYSGAQASAYMGMYDAHGDGGGWDGKTQMYSFTMGTSDDRSAVLFSAGYRNSNPVLYSNRTDAKYPDPANFKGTLFGSSNIPQGKFTFMANPGDPNLPGYASSLCGTTAHSNGLTVCDIAGPIAPGAPGYNPHAFTNYDRYNYMPANYMQDGYERWHAYIQGHYDLTDNVTFSTNTLYTRRNTLLVGAAAPLGIGANGFLPNAGMPIGIAGNNPYNPFHVDLVPFTQASATTGNPKYVSWCRQYGSGANGGCTADHYYLTNATNRDIAGGQRLFNYSTSTFRFTGQFNGYFNLANNQWNWNVGYDYENQRTNRLAKNLYNDARLAQALGNVNNCPSASCVPYDFFGGSQNVTKAQRDYVHYTANTTRETQMRDYTANLAGNFWNSWYAGPWGLALGYEYNDTAGRFVPDPLVSQGISSTNGTLPSNGRLNDNAQYAELRIPFGANVPGLEKLDLDLATRWAQFKTHGSGAVSTGGPPVPTQGGNHYAVNVSHAGIKWQPVQSLLIRAAWTQGFRVPSVSELFSGGQQSYSPVVDPCATPSPAPGCPAGATQPNGQILTTFGGNANLKPENSISQSVGFVYSPTWAPGLNFSMDYYKVFLTNAIQQIGPGQILQDCYSNNPQYCNDITRVGGVITNINASTQNLGSLHTNGIDFGINYRFPATSIGQFSASLNGNFIKFFTSCSPSGNCSNSAGSGFNYSNQGLPKHKYQLQVNWDYGPWAATWRTKLIGPMYEQCMSYAIFGVAANSATANLFYKQLKNFGYAGNLPHCSNPNKGAYGQNHIGTVVYHDVQASYTVESWNTTFTLGVNNLFNKQPPLSQVQVGSPAYYTYNYRVPGRFFYGRISVKF